MRALTPATRLRTGDAVAIVAPAGPVTEARLADGRALLESWGLVPVLGRHALAETGYLAGSDADRRADLQDALDRPEIRAVIAARGGYGTQRLVDGLDLDGLVADPKPILGFSDLTALHLAVHRRAGIITFHGPGAAWDSARTGAGSAGQLRRLLMGAGPPGPVGEPASLVAGRAYGVLEGGNLAMLTSTVGTVDAPDLEGAILLLEDVGEPAYRIDRMLTQLLRSRLLDGVAGFALGSTEIVGAGPSFEEIAVERLGALGVPMVGDLPLGHGPGQLTVPLGARCVIDGGLSIPGDVTSL